MKKYFFISIIAIACFNCTQQPVPRKIWSVEQAKEWYKQWGWLRGCNFIPSTAINQLEMWQAETFDPATIDRELGFAEDIGMNCMRVYLHHLAWETDKEGFKKRMNDYLTIANKHGISTIFVLFDDCWNPTYTAGKQPEPQPGVHNSGWLQDPGNLLYQDTTLIVKLETYLKDVLTSFKDDKRIVFWDLYNEPGSGGYGSKSLALLQKAFIWARTVNPSQPLSSGVGLGLFQFADLIKFQLENSDVVTYHAYEIPDVHKQLIDSLKKYERPMICTEYMARTNGSSFQTIMPMLKEENIGAINWGLVAGKTNTIFAWSTPLPDVEEPPLWFHDIFRKDGTPFSQEEIDCIKTLTMFACTQKAPHFEMRGVVLTVEDLETVDWPKLVHENGINTIGTHITPVQVAAFIQSEKGKKFLADCEKYGIYVEHQLHAMGQLLPRELFSEDTTLFRMNKEGRRVNDFNLCVHSQKALDIVAANAQHYAEILPATNHRYYFWIDDACPMCACEKCSEYSDSEQALLIENRIIKELRKHDPEAQLAHLAYLSTYEAPHRVKPEEGIFLEFAPISRSWDKPLLDEQTKGRENATHKELMQHLKDNLTVFPVETAVVLEYWLDVSLFSRWQKPAVKLPWHKEVFESDIDTYASLGIRNITTFAAYIDDKYIDAYKDLNFLKEYGEGLKKWTAKFD